MSGPTGRNLKLASNIWVVGAPTMPLNGTRICACEISVPVSYFLVAGFQREPDVFSHWSGG